MAGLSDAFSDSSDSSDLRSMSPPARRSSPRRIARPSYFPNSKKKETTKWKKPKSMKSTPPNHRRGSGVPPNKSSQEQSVLMSQISDKLDEVQKVLNTPTSSILRTKEKTSKKRAASSSHLLEGAASKASKKQKTKTKKIKKRKT
jgi:hypothetical protein